MVISNEILDLDKTDHESEKKVSHKRGVQPSCPLFSEKVADYFSTCFDEDFDLFMIFYPALFPLFKVQRGFEKNFGLLDSLTQWGSLR